MPILLGVIGRAHGIRGRARVTSHTADPVALTAYGPLSDGTGRRFTLRWVGEGVAEIFEIIDGAPVKITSRAAAERLTNTKLFVGRAALPPPEEDEYYLTDLTGLAAVDEKGAALGLVAAVHDHGAGVILEIAREHGASLLIPFTAACVPEVNIAAGRVVIAPPDEIDVPQTHIPGPNGVEPDDPGQDAPEPDTTQSGVSQSGMSEPGVSEPDGAKLHGSAVRTESVA